jgi:hypothetical protein
LIYRKSLQNKRPVAKQQIIILSNVHQETNKYQTPSLSLPSFHAILLLTANTKNLLATALTMLSLAATLAPTRAAITESATLASLASLATAETVLRYLHGEGLDGQRGSDDRSIAELGVLFVLVPLTGCRLLGRLGLGSRNRSLGCSSRCLDSLGGLARDVDAGQIVAGGFVVAFNRLGVRIGVLNLLCHVNGNGLEFSIGSRDRTGCADIMFLTAESGRPIKVLRLASVVDFLAVVVPGIATVTAGGRSIVPAVTNFVPALLGRSPTAILIRVFSKGLAAPVGVLGQAALGNKTVLLGLLGTSLLGSGIPDIGSVNRVFAMLIVDIEGYGGVFLGDIARDTGFVLFGNLKRTFRAVLDEDLSTALVELRVAVGSTVQGENLRADQVVSRRKAGRKVDRQKSVVFDETVDAPLVLLDVVAIFKNLEPSVSSSRVRKHIIDPLHVDGARASVAFGNSTLLVAAGRFTELEGQLSTAWGRTDILNSLASIST